MKYKLILVFLLLLTLVPRLYRFDNPIGDWHAFRQADTSAVSKVFTQNGFQVFTPTYFDISNIQSGVDNPHGYRMVEFPIYNVFQAGGYFLFGAFTIEQWGRIVTIFSSLLSVIFIFLLTKKYSNGFIAFFASVFYAILPFSVYYGRVILPDPSASMAILAGIYFFDRWIENISRNKLKRSRSAAIYFVLAIIFTASAFLLKPFTLFFALPMFYIAWNIYGFSFFRKWFLWLFLVLAIIPLVFWRLWIAQFSEGIPASNWLFNEGGIRFTGAYFYWIFADRIGKLVLGYTAYIFLFLGFIKRKDAHFGFFLTFAISSIMYLIIVARGNVQHDYYQILIIPTICMFLGRGLFFLVSLSSSSIQNSKYNTIASMGIVFIVFFSTILFSWYHVRDYFNINNLTLVTAGKTADAVLPKDAKVIAANNGDTSFLYYIGRKGWPAFQKSPEELIEMGATHMVIPSPTVEDVSGFGSKYKQIYFSEEVLILELSSK